jgi:DNA primase
MTERILFPSSRFTTKHLVDTYEQLSPALLPHLVAHPLTVKRYPSDINGEAFWE